jgi:cell division protein FtsL
MEKFLVRKKIVSNTRNAKALLGLFAVTCFTLSGYIFTKTIAEQPAYFVNSEVDFI